MEYSPSRRTLSDYYSSQPSSRRPEMAMLTATPAPHAVFQKEYPWDNSRFPLYPSRPSQRTGSVSLPSIRHQFPELLSPESPVYPRSMDTSSSTAPGYLISPTYDHSPVSNKRGRASAEDEQERERARQVPRLYRSPEHSTRQPPSPVRAPQVAESWVQPARVSPFSSGRGGIPAPVEVHESVEPRPSLPNLPPTLGSDRSSVSRPSTREHAEEYRDGRQAAAQTAPAPALVETAPRYAAPTYDYSYRHTSQVHSVSTSPTHNYDRTPFSAGAHARQYADYTRYPDLGGHIGMGSDNKQRKRRGNLPKETTDKLRAWFMGHLSHPYPTEDEKQELMRQTGLQMNQISNWFINARRRQLPTMINNARVESGAISVRATDGTILPSTERPDLHGKREGLTLSDGEGGAYDEELENFKQQRGPTIKRGSV